MSAPRPFWTDPFHPLGSISNMKQFLYIYNSVPINSSMWYVQVFVYDNCACALTQNSNYDPESFLKSFFPRRYMLVCIETSFMPKSLFLLRKGFKRKQKRRLN